MDIKYKILMSLVLVLAFSFSFSSAIISKWDYIPIGTINNSYYNNTYINQSNTFNSTQFETGEPVTIKMNWLQSMIQLYAPSPDLSLYALISDLVSLVGNWTADKPNYYNTSQVDALIPTTYNPDFVRIYENDFWITGDGYYPYTSTGGSTGKINTAESSVFVRLTNTANVGADARLEFLGTQAGASTTANDGTINPNLTISFLWIGNKAIGNLSANFVIGCYATSTEQNLNTLNRGLGFKFNNTAGDNNLYPFSQTVSGLTQLEGINISGTLEYLSLNITSNNPANAYDSTATNFTFWKKQQNDAEWVNLGYIDTNIGYENEGCSSWGIWLEKSVAGTTTSNPTIYTDYAEVIMSRENRKV
jgi:hypothetical protein